MNSLAEQSRAAGYSDPFSREKNDDIYKRLAHGEQSARDEMIQGNMALVIVKVDAYLRQNPQMAYFRDDLVSVGLIALCKAVDTMRRRGLTKGANPTGYIYATIDNHLMEAADEESTIVVPYRTQKRAREEGKPIERPRPVGPKTTESCFSRLSTADLAAGYDLEDEIKACCRDDIDVKVVAMRIAGHKDQEIAEALGLAGHQAVSRRRKKIENRLKERCAEYAR